RPPRHAMDARMDEALALGRAAPPRDDRRRVLNGAETPSSVPAIAPEENTMRLAHVLLLASFTLLALAPSARAQSPLKLNEFLAGPARDWDGSGALSTRDDEWIEVMNGGAAPLDLSGYL